MQRYELRNYGLIVVGGLYSIFSHKMTSNFEITVCNFEVTNIRYSAGASFKYAVTLKLAATDPTVLPYPLSYFESESLESLSLWQQFFFCNFFWGFLTVFSCFEKHSKICVKELVWSFLPLPLHFCPTAAFLLKPFLRVPSFSYLWHSPVLWVVCVPPCFWHSAQLF
jgi:hypothetical protein